MSDTTAPSRTLELFVRSLSSSDMGVRIDEVLDQLNRLRADGCVDEYTVTVWGERMSTNPITTRTDEGAFIRSRIVEFRQWAHEHDVTLEGGFETRTIHSAITGETHEFITLPSLVLTARHNDTLEWIVPFSGSDGPVTSVWDHLTSLMNEQPDSEERRSLPAVDV
ncbi:HTH domain-containing protein [Halocatena marina]|uniref:HTH domain-containing protein n=1 Tax=Halocatena marina TaxID=2934937 RepID=A0ABD5YND3_9EURY|nr:HTH domain-containing protein [Halocatena marina]